MKVVVSGAIKEAFKLDIFVFKLHFMAHWHGINQGTLRNSERSGRKEKQLEATWLKKKHRHQSCPFRYFANKAEESITIRFYLN